MLQYLSRSTRVSRFLERERDAMLAAGIAIGTNETAAAHFGAGVCLILPSLDAPYRVCEEHKKIAQLACIGLNCANLGSNEISSRS